MAFRVLVTGSRTWVWPSDVVAVLDDFHTAHGDGLVIVHGACRRGADAIADAWGVRRKVRMEPFLADWSLGRRAGFVRNAAMVNSWPDCCVAFIRDGSPGASHCAGLAERAGIPTIRIER